MFVVVVATAADSAPPVHGGDDDCDDEDGVDGAAVIGAVIVSYSCFPVHSACHGSILTGCSDR